jgi:hypothetical protein
MGWTTGVRFLARVKDSSHSLCIQLPTQWVLVALYPEVKRPGREADLSPPSSAEFKKEWSYTSTTPYVFMSWFLISAKDNSTSSQQLRVFALNDNMINEKLIRMVIKGSGRGLI